MEQQRPWYETLFEGPYLRLWKPSLEKQDAKAQVDGALAIMRILEGAEILDLCCGYGRHALELARRGYRVTGLDLCAEFLEMGRRAAEEEGLQVEFVRSDMRQIPFEERFDAVINMFTAWGYFEDDAENLEVFRQVARALKPGGKFLLDQPNWPNLWTRFRAQDWDRREDGLLVLRERKPDWVNGRLRERQMVIEADGKRWEHTLATATYAPSEIIKMFREAGLVLKGLYGGFDASDFSLESRRAVYLAEKSE